MLRFMLLRVFVTTSGPKVEHINGRRYGSLWNFMELYVRGRSSGTLRNFIKGLMERNNYGLQCYSLLLLHFENKINDDDNDEILTV